MKLLYTLILILVLIGCKSKSDNGAEPKSEDRKTTKVYGDSLKIVFEYRGDTVIQNRIDLKGTSDDGFDSSFSIKSIWSTKLVSDLNCKQKLRLNQDNIDFTFCLKDAIQKIEMDIKDSEEKPWILDGLKKIKNDLVLIRNGETDSLSMRTYYLTFDLLRNIDFSIYHNEQNSKIEKVSIEKYETNFSGGYNYYLINKQNDTIARFDVNEWMS